ncbi:MAG: hypothetical protein EOP83_22100 [Verrucomicrobiaceae bacterium]|nr:MAG: hypothetical protein EOP83_22100 [Verrucomicrobiaceae bacterium]
MSQDRFLTVDATQADALVARATAAMKVLPPKDQTFISSMLTQHEKHLTRKDPMKRLSGAQWWWMNQKAETAETRNEVIPERERVEIGDMKGIIRMFDMAKQHLKKPGVTYAIQADEVISSVRLKPASPNGRVPDSIDVVRDGLWLGRILKSGDFEISPRTKDEAREIVVGLREFAANPETGAKKSARLTGRCCFCNGFLKDERSTNAGYGPVCASHFGLAWGK